MLRRIGTWKLMGARSIRNVIRTCASCSPRASTSMRATVILNLLIPSLGLLAQTNIDPNVVTQRRRPPPAGMHVGGFSCSVLKPNARVSLVQRAVVSSLIRFLPVILMIVKEASYPSLERRCLLQITDGAGAVEELPLELRGNSIPAHKHGSCRGVGWN